MMRYPGWKAATNQFKETTRKAGRALFGLLLATVIGAAPAWATPFTMTVPGTDVQIPGTYPEAGGIVLVLRGVNGNYYYQISNPSVMMRGYQDQADGLLSILQDATSPQNFRGQPAWQLAPAYTIDCGILSCSAYFGGGVEAGWVRFSVDDGDTDRNGGLLNFDVDDITLLLADTPDGTDPDGPVDFSGAAVIGNWSDPATQTTNISGTVASASTTGFPDSAFNTGWFTISSPTVLSTFLQPGRIVRWGASDVDPNDNHWDFTIGNDADTSSVPERVAPGLRMTLTPQDASFEEFGDTVDYEYLLENVGTVFIEDLSISDDQIATVTCPQTRLEPNESIVCTATDIVTQADLDNGGISNTATAIGTPQAATLGPTTATAFVPATSQVSSLAIDMPAPVNTDADGSGTISLGDTLTYTVTATNTGTVTQSAVQISSPLLSPASQTCAVVARAGTCVLSGALPVTQADVDAGTISIVAGVTSDRIATPVEGTQTTSIAQVQALSLDKRALTASYDSVGDSLSYSYVVTNIGNVTITAPVTVSDNRIASVSCPGLPLGGLGPNAAVTCTASDTVSQADIDAGAVSNTATASADGTISPADTVTINAVQSAGLSVTKTASPQTYSQVGQTIAYTYEVTNTGNVVVTNAVSISDDQVSVSCPALPSGGLAPGQSLTCMATDMIAQADLDAGSLTNTATATDGTTLSPPVSETVTAEQTRSFSLAVSATPQAYSAVGDQITYEYTVTNTGNVRVFDVISISDDRIPAIACPAVPAEGLAPDETLSCTGQDTVNQADLDAGEITNTATASDGVATSAPISVTVMASQSPALSISKSADVTAVASPARVGDEIAYQISVRNAGNVTLEGVLITDILLGGDITADCTFPDTAGVLAVGAEAVCALNYNIAQADIDLGTVSNTASVTAIAPGNTAVSEALDAPVETLLAQAPALSMVNTATEINFTLPGDEVTYAYVVTNTGNTTITAPISVTDDQIASVSCPALPAGGLAPTETLTCGGVYVVTQLDLSHGWVTNLATATDGITTSPIVSETIPFSQSPGLVLEKTSPDTSYANVDDVLTYVFTLRNTGNLTLTGDIEITDDRIGTFVCFTGNLVPGASVQCQRTDLVSQVDLDSGAVTNQSFAINGAAVSDPVSLTINASLSPALTFAKRALTTTYENVGDTIFYAYDVTNSGNVTISSIEVNDDGIGVVICPASVLAPTESMTCTAIDLVSQADVNAGSVTHAASVSGVPAGGTLPVVTATVTVNASQIVSLDFVKTALTLSYSEPGDILNYQYRVENTGNVSVLSLLVSDDRISGVVCPVTALEPGEVTICTGVDIVSQADLDVGSVTNTAILSIVAAAGSLPPQSVEVTVFANHSPALSLQKAATQASFDMPGDVLDYTYTVTNSGNTTLTDQITISDDRIASVSCATIPEGGLAPDDILICTGTDTATQADLDAGFVRNTAFASSGATRSEDVTISVSAAQTRSLSVEKTAQAASFSSAMEPINYTYDVTNTGNVTLNGSVNVTDNLISSVNCPAVGAGGLAPGDELTCTGLYWTSQSDVDTGSVTNTANAALDGIVSATVSETVTASQSATLSLVSEANPRVYNTDGQLISYTFTVTNTGNVTLTEAITVADNRVTDVSCPPLPAEGLAPEEALTCTGTYTITQGDLDVGSVINLATASSGAVTSPQASETVTAEQVRAMETVKTVTREAFSNPGDETEYAYTVTNTGNVTLTTPITVTDNLIASVSCPTLPAGGLAPQQSLTCTGTYIITQEDLDRGSVTNIASSSDGTTDSPPTSATIPANALPSIVVTTRSLTDRFDAAGDNLTYEYTVRNNGNVTLTGETIVEDDKIGSFTCFDGNITPSQIVTCQADYTVQQSDVDAGSVTNVAFARNGDVSSTVVEVTVSAEQNPELSLGLTALDSGFAMPGDTLSYEYLVTNTGNTSIVGAVSIADDRVTDITCAPTPSGGLAPDQGLLCTGGLTVTQQDVDRGFITNTATASGGAVQSAPQQITVSAEQDRALALALVPLDASYAAVGDVLDYDYILTNSGNTTLSGALSIADDVVTDISCPSLPQGGLAPGGQITCRGMLAVTQAMLDAGRVTNNAAASIGAVNSTQVAASVLAEQTPELMVILTDDTSALSDPVRAGETITYTTRVQNTGNQSLTDVRVNEMLSGRDVTTGCGFPGVAGELGVGTSSDCTFTYDVTQADVGAGGVSNTVVVTARGPADQTVTDTSDAGDEGIETAGLNGETDGDPSNDPTVSFFQPAPALAVSVEVNDNGARRAGDQIAYVFVLTNTGTVTLSGVPVFQAGRVTDIACEVVSPIGLAPGESASCTGALTLTQADVDAGEISEDISLQIGGIFAPIVTTEVTLQQAPLMRLEMSASAPVHAGGSLFDVVYTLTVVNSGNVTLTGVQLTNDLVAAFAPAHLVSVPVISQNGLGGTDVLNSAYDGAAETSLLGSDARLGAGNMAVVSIETRIDVTQGIPAAGNVASATSDQVVEPVLSDDPAITPDDQSDQNATRLDLSDTDGDGVPDGLESMSADRDGDGIADSEDYDPTGYFYCQENGAILTGGRIAVVGPSGRNDAIGTRNGITIVSDGSSGFYQFFVSAPGRYVIEPTYPQTGQPSEDRLVSSEAFDVSTGLPSNPIILGSGEVGSSGQLADASAAANPVFYFSFDIEAGDPAVFFNNIPLQSCGVPGVSLSKFLVGDPQRLPDGRMQTVFDITATNTGQTVLEDVVIEDNLAAAFDGGAAQMLGIEILEAPASFAAKIDPAYDGNAVASMVSGDGELAQGEQVSVRLSVASDAQTAGDFTNTATVAAKPPFAETVTANAQTHFTIDEALNTSQLRVTKTARPSLVQIGDPVRYRVTVENTSSFDMSGFRIVDRPPSGLGYVPGSAIISDERGNRVQLEPEVSRGHLAWALTDETAGEVATLPANASLTVELAMVATPQAAFGTLTNSAFVQDPLTGATSEIATAVVEFLPEPTFDCTPVIGRVFEDENRNGYHDAGEPGLAGARLLSVNGDIVETDEHGRYHVPCAVVPDAERGSNYVLKTDMQSLPLGFEMTTQNPLIVRATRGKAIRMNFGAAPSANHGPSAAKTTEPALQTSISGFEADKQLSLSTELIAQGEGEALLYAYGFWNYGHWIERAELRLFKAGETVRGEPLQVIALDETGSGFVPVALKGSGEFAAVLRVYDASGRFDETRPRRVGGQARVHLAEPGAERFDAFGVNALNISNIPVSGATVRVFGRGIASETADVFGQKIGIDPDGKFVAEAILPDGLQTINAHTEAGRMSDTINIQPRRYTGTGIIETTIGQRQTDEGGVSAEGRAAFYLRGRLTPRLRFTATADTGEAGLDDLFGQLDERDARSLLRRLDPDRFYPVYGDDSTITEDAPTSGRFYLRVERDDDYVVWGNYHTNFNDTEFARVERTLYGAKLHWDSAAPITRIGDARSTLDAFLSDPGTRSARDELRGTGGSVYFLRNADIVIGSDIVRVETKDVVSGIVLESRILAYGDDYDIDYIQGRVLLNQPLGSTSEDGRLFADGGLSGNEVFLVVAYEFTGALGEFDQLAFGGRGTHWVGDHLKLGGTYARDIQDGEETDIYGADLTLQLTGETFARAEIALTDGAGLSTFRSLDGGFSYTQQSVADTAQTPLAVLLEAKASLADFGFGEGQASIYYRNREAGFAGFGEQTANNATQYGAALKAPISNDLDLKARVDVAQGGFGADRAVGEAFLDTKLSTNISVQTGVSYQDDARVADSLAVATRLQYRTDEQNLAYIFGQAGVAGTGNDALTDRFGLGAELNLNDKLTAGAEVSSGAAGLGSQINIRYAKDDFSETYLNYDLPTRSNVGAQTGGLSNVDGGLTLGARRRLVDGLSVFGEERRRFGSAENGFAGLTRAFGVDYSPAEAWTFGLSTEFGDVGPFDREAFSLSAGYSKGRISAAATAEARFDENRDTGEALDAYLLRVTTQAQVSEGLRLQGKVNYADADGSANGGAINFQAAKFTEASIAAAYRPVAHDRLNVLAKLVYLEDLSPAGQRISGDLIDFRQRSAIGSLDVTYQATQRCAIGMKYGYRSGEVTEGRDSADFFTSRAWLGVGRLDCNITGKWDGLLEARYLNIGGDVLRQWGGQTGLYRNLGDHIRLGGGLTWGGVNDAFVALNAQRNLGWYMNLIGTF